MFVLENAKTLKTPLLLFPIVKRILSDNLVCFYNKNAQKMNFSSNCANIFPQIAHIIQGTLLAFLPDSLGCFLNYETFKP